MDLANCYRPNDRMREKGCILQLRTLASKIESTIRACEDNDASSEAFIGYWGVTKSYERI